MKVTITPARRTLARFVLPDDILPAPDPAAVAAESMPAWDAACQTDAGVGVRACKRCGSLLDAPCVTCSGKACGDHKGRAW